jgi:hypothetical protein
MRFFFPILLGQAFCEKFHFPTLFSFVLLFFFFFFFQAAKLNYVRFEECRVELFPFPSYLSFLFLLD